MGINPHRQVDTLVSLKISQSMVAHLGIRCTIVGLNRAYNSTGDDWFRLGMVVLREAGRGLRVISLTILEK